jgi:demethylmenaquinone methyltransferase/2-methoxy-6-polyprenyl-1,4-benzoquinol methylase
VTDNVVLQAFTELAPNYEATIDWELRELCGLGYREFLGYLVEAMPRIENQMVLDVASGTAVSSVEVGRRLGATHRVVGLDITPAMMQHGAENILKADLSAQISQVCGSGMAMPLAAQSFDTVFCGLGTHHMDVPALLSEVRRVLKAGGHLIMADVGAPAKWRSPWGRALMKIVLSVFKFIWRGARARAEADAFASIHTAEEWRGLLANCGLVQVEVTEWPPRRFWYPGALIIRATSGS